MKASHLNFLWHHPEAVHRFRSGVCLHGHTMHSRECLSFLPRYLHYVPGISQAVRRYQRARPGSPAAVDFSRAYWTPPLNPTTALNLERQQIAGFDLHPLVSLTDHDDIEAGIALQVTSDRRHVPVSVEWTVPYQGSILHLGIHNLPPENARRWMSAMGEYTSAPNEALLPEILQELSAIPEVLTVLNHPYWLEEGVTAAAHQSALPHFLHRCVPWIHAFELNGTRSWKENEAAVVLARAYSRPLISGGDRHACEPAACINLTNARSFSEFATEIRDGHSTIVFMPHYQEPMALRILEASWEIVRTYPECAGRERWIDRFFYVGEDAVARPLSTVWKDHVPWMLNSATAILQLAATTKLRLAIRLLLMQRGEILP
jgi:hypothetical protein